MPGFCFAEVQDLARARQEAGTLQEACHNLRRVFWERKEVSQAYLEAKAKFETHAAAMHRDKNIAGAHKALTESRKAWEAAAKAAASMAQDGKHVAEESASLEKELEALKAQRTKKHEEIKRTGWTDFTVQLPVPPTIQKNPKHPIQWESTLSLPPGHPRLRAVFLWVMIREQLLRWRAASPDYLVNLLVIPELDHAEWSYAVSRVTGLSSSPLFRIPRRR